MQRRERLIGVDAGQGAHALLFDEQALTRQQPHEAHDNLAEQGVKRLGARRASRVKDRLVLGALVHPIEHQFADTDSQAKATRDPVAPAKRSKAALLKAARHTLDDGTPVHSFSTLLDELATIVRNTCRTPNAAPDTPSFEILTTPNTKQQRALKLIEDIRLYTETGIPTSNHVLVAQRQTRSERGGTSV